MQERIKRELEAMFAQIAQSGTATIVVAPEH
jgi:hypothetical protein